MSAAPRIRISWSPPGPLYIDELSFGGQVLVAGAERHGGVFEAALPPAPLSPLLGWQLRAVSCPSAPVDEIRVEVRDCAGAWHLLGELLGGGGIWRGERLVASLAQAAQGQTPTLVCSAR